MKTIVLGPPGTGKTTTLLNEVDMYLKQTDPDKIGYFSFTQKAAYEARDRAMLKFNLSEDGNCHGAPLFSILEKTKLSSEGAADSSITRYLLKSIIIDKGSILIGQASTQALQDVHAHISSFEI